MAQSSLEDFWRIQSYGSVDSTNRIIKDALRNGEQEGICALALQQSQGYGRQGRTWVSPVGGLYMSFALRPTRSFDQIPTLSLVVSLALCRALSDVCQERDVRIKWPNDVLCDGGKLAGISLEALRGSVCVGVGINIFPSSAATSVSGKYVTSFVSHESVSDDLDAEQRIVMMRIVSNFLQCVERLYKQWNREGFASFLEEYRGLLAFKGAAITMETIDGSRFAQGVLEDVDALGRLLVRQDSGELQAVASGEVHITMISDQYA